VVPAIFAMGGLLAGCIGMYFALSISWTHLFVRPDRVTAVDFYTVIALSIFTGLVAGTLALIFSARRYRFPQTRAFRSDLHRPSKRPALTL